MTVHHRVVEASESLKVFPLPSAVLLPHSVLPLHIFEPRYREMVRDALEGDQVMALAQLEPGWEPRYAERPAMQPMLCAGLIVWHEALEEGRYNILLQGVCRARLVAELPTERLYRQVRVELLPDSPYSGPEEEQLRQAVFELAGRVPPSFSEGLLPAVARARGGTLADVVGAAVIPEPERRQALLAELDVRRRLEAVMEEVGELIARLQPMRPVGPLN
ncbi:LON peptidase substrate-binding domain-containing protein [Stigmatella aurantiaca]|uniref:ATP-dependent protease La domain protein n=1 Tax=Stigmatella aurantiaca (strain DW4/3-1) TaxID=378806 RepID=Q08PC0_STIAD|nr:LON peptidase substrate-binding domain-containing protein [Stigmatella aurantiaca]ADO68805.1 Peptidase S16 [Stigmatella aurantiaca DW4/3-1]EAU62326.1 ATP-dependent protease La domain protein [Stigmatella aurantiaca DW4/3-1]